MPQRFGLLAGEIGVYDIFERVRFGQQNRQLIGFSNENFRGNLNLMESPFECGC